MKIRTNNGAGKQQAERVGRTAPAVERKPEVYNFNRIWPYHPEGFRGQPLSEIEDYAYLRWALENIEAMPPDLYSTTREYLSRKGELND